MTSTLLTLTLAAVLAGDSSPSAAAPKRSPYAPSLPYLTKEEEQKLDDTIERFMQADIGLLRGLEAGKAKDDFAKLGPEAIPALIRGLNRAARIQHSCPAVVIAKKVQRLLLASDDLELLQFARDEIGSGVGRTRHAPLLQDLRFRVLLHRNAVARRGPSVRPGKRTLTVQQLADAASTERGPRLKAVLIELEKREGKEVLSGLSLAASSYDHNTQELGRGLLDRHLSRQPMGFVKEKLRDGDAEVRKAAVRVVLSRWPKLGGDLIDLLADDDAEVRDAAHRALVRLSRGSDFGPSSAADKAEREQAQQKWRDWWRRQN